MSTLSLLPVIFTMKCFPPVTLVAVFLVALIVAMNDSVTNIFAPEIVLNAVLFRLCCFPIVVVSEQSRRRVQ